MPYHENHPASYRDPSGFMFHYNGILYRQVNQSFKNDFNFFIQSGLYDHLANGNFIIPHKVIDENFTGDLNWYKTIQPAEIPVVSYPFEWCFDLLKDAALLTLTLAEIAMQYGMMLKDASAYNVQLYNGKPVFIDTLSFEKLDASKPWIAYRQFCEMFLAPLALMNFLKTSLQPLLLAYPEGIPLQTAKKLLPLKSTFNMGCYLHLHLHADYINKKPQAAKQQPAFSKQKISNILQSLKQTIASFQLNVKTNWSRYYDEAAQRPDYLSEKKRIVDSWISKLPQLKSAIDVGANEGVFAELLSSKNIFTIAADSDHYVVNTLYNKVKNGSVQNLVPVLADLTNPSPAMGVNNEEHRAFTDRVKSDLVVALALIHHLAIGRNIPFRLVALQFKKLGAYLIIEFVPREDEKIKGLLLHKKDIYDWYTQEGFENAFQQHFKIMLTQEIKPSGRILYLMQQYEA